MTIHTLTEQARTWLERALSHRDEQRAAARYFATIGHDLPPAKRAEWLRDASRGAPQYKHRVS